MPALPDLLVEAAAGRWTGPLIRRMGLPAPRRLRREAGPYRGDELAGRRLSFGAADGAYAIEAATAVLSGLGAELHAGPVWSTRSRIDVALFDATGCVEIASLGRLRAFFGPVLRQIAPCARLLVLAPDPERAADAVAAAAARAIEGFVRSLAKEVGRQGATANLLRVPPAAVDRLAGPLRFLCSHRSTYVSGQALGVSDDLRLAAGADQGLPRLDNRVAIVTGAARGLGAATAERLAEEGAGVLCVDVPSAKHALEALAQRIGGLPLALDITAADAAAQIVDWLREQTGGVDLVVHNAGITRDRTLLKMSEAEWDAVMAVNLTAVTAIDAAIDAAGLLRDDAREVCLSSISGIAGNVGQTNYAATKAGLMGYVRRRARQLAARGITVNAVAPGFIESDMTQRMPLMIREAGRRLNALAQGGQPRDVAEAIAFLLLPESAGVSGQTLRVCGQALLGA